MEYPYNPEESKDWKEKCDQKEDEEDLLKRNRAHFGQALRTPLATTEMLERIPFTADPELAEQVLPERV